MLSILDYIQCHCWSSGWDEETLCIDISSRVEFVPRAMRHCGRVFRNRPADPRFPEIRKKEEEVS